MSNTTDTTIDPAYAAENNVVKIMVPLTIFHIIALIFVGCRMYAKKYLTNSVGLDDWLMMIGSVFALAGFITFVGLAFNGLGRHQSTLPKDEVIRFNKWDYSQTITCHITSLSLVKISICLSLLRLSNDRLTTWVLWPTIAILAASGISGYVSFFIRCIPLQKWFDDTVDGWCYPMSTFISMALYNTVLNITSDVICATIPIPIVHRLQMPYRTKVYLIFIFSLAYGAVVFGILKGVFQFGWGGVRDNTFHFWINFWGFLQLNFGMIAACASSLRPLFGGILGLRSDPSSRGQSDGNSKSRSKSMGLRTIGGGPMNRGSVAHNERGNRIFGSRDPEAGSLPDDFELNGKAVRTEGHDYIAKVHRGAGGDDGDSTDAIVKSHADVVVTGKRSDDGRESSDSGEELSYPGLPRAGIMRTIEFSSR